MHGNFKTSWRIQPKFRASPGREVRLEAMPEGVNTVQQQAASERIR